MRLSRNEIKLTFGRPNYYVNEKEGTVKCRVSYHLQVPYDADGELFIAPEKYSSVTAIAKCGAGDKFNAEVGKKVARAKAESRAYSRCANHLAKDMERSFMRLTILNNFIEKAYDCVEHNNKYLKKNF